MDVFTLNQTSKEAFSQPKVTPLAASQGSGNAQKAETAAKQEAPVKVFKPVVPEPVKKAQTQAEYPDLHEIAKQVQAKLKSANVDIEFEVSHNNKQVIMRIKDPVTGDVVREIPSDSLVKNANALLENNKDLMLQGLGIDVKF